MTEAATQTVVDETKPAPGANGAETDALDTGGDDLDKLLSQFDTEARASSAAVTFKPEQTATDPDLKTLAKQVQGDLGEIRAANYRRDMDQTIKDVRGDLDPEIFDDDLIESALDSMARKDPRLAKAWMDRSANPRQFEKVKTELGKALAKKFSKIPNKDVTEDRVAVAHAVRGASTRAPIEQPSNYTGMGNADFKGDVEKKYGYTPAV